MTRRLICLLLTMALCLGCCSAELAIPRTSAGEALLADYIALVNQDLSAAGAREINSLFLCFPATATLGVTNEDNAEIPQDVELQVTMSSQGLVLLVLRCVQPDQFAQLAAACIHCAAPDSITYADALKTTQAYSSRVKKSPDRGFSEPVNEQQGTSVRTYYAYQIKPLGEDDHNWLQLTLVFPLPGSGGAGVSTTPVPQNTPAPDEEYAGIRTYDQYDHFQLFATPTPEPDSPAAESAY